MKLWGGRFEKTTDTLVADFHSSITFDQRLYREDITGSIAHARMLGSQGIIPREDAQAIIEGLQGILRDIEEGHVTFRLDAEDIHMNIEQLLTERIGEAGKRLHTGRSRNDQVALDARLYVRRIARESCGMLLELCDVLLRLAAQHTDSFMPGYTHLQRAQPVTLAHHLLAYLEMFLRDADRMLVTADHANVCPLGSGALAGTTYPLDRRMVAGELGFADITHNSLDGVSDRDFILDYLYSASVAMMHLSRFCEELILWNSHEFRFVIMDDAYSTGSSIMPQKKNPDMAELTRGKTGRVYGDLMGLLATMKGLPLAYNKDMQEDKEALFDARDTLTKALSVFTPMLSTCTFDTRRMAACAAGGFTNATDAADYLVKKGLPFRDAHAVIGRMVLECEQKGLAILDLTLEQLRTYSPLFEADVFDACSIAQCVSQRSVEGGPAPRQTEEAIRLGQDRVAALRARMPQ